MSFIDNIINKLFPKGKNSHKSILHEVILRKKTESLNYQRWLKSMDKFEQIGAIERSYKLAKENVDSEPTILIMNTAYSNGFAIPYNSMYSRDEFRFIFDYFKDQVLKMDYRLAGSDRKIREKQNNIETVEKHYLKPPLNYKDKVTDQQYGNILIEHVSINDKPDHIKIMANIYSDRLYSEAKSFDEFMERLFKS